MTGWLSGVCVRRMERGQTPVADVLCVVCGEHRRATGRQVVADLMRSDPISSHRSVCPGPGAPGGRRPAGGGTRR
jgi:hypothetical protein